MPPLILQSKIGGRRLQVGSAGVAFGYALAALAWIFASDLVIAEMFSSSLDLQLVKGAGFVAVTALVLYGLLRANDRREVDLMDRLREAAERSRDGFWRWRVEADVFTVTTGGNRDLGWEAAQSIDSLDGWRKVVHPDDWRLVEKALAPILAGQAQDFTLDHRVKAIDGDWIWYRVRGHVAERGQDGGPAMLTGAYTNIDGLKRRELALRRANRALDSVAAVNRASLAARDRESLLDGVCRALAAPEDAVLVWIGEAEAGGEKRVRPISSRGPAQGFLQAAPIGWGADPYGQGPTGRALRSGAPEVVVDARRSPLGYPWREELARFEIRSTVTIPFQDGERRCILQINSREPEAFSMDEIAAYQALAHDLARALGAFTAQQGYELRLSQALRGAVAALAATVEKRDPYTAGHQSRTGDLAVEIARELGLAADRIEGVRLGAAMHDIGKIGVPVEILTKPGRLDPQEMALVRRHPEIGYDIVKEIDFGWPIADIVRQHHERWDGSGYPQGLKGEAIALEARIVAAADVIESMATHRPYRPALPTEAVVTELTEGRGLRYDPKVADAALKVLARTPIEPQACRPVTVSAASAVSAA